MNNIEILEEFLEQYNASYPEEKEWVAIYPNQIEAIENLLENSKKIIELNYIPKSKIKEIIYPTPENYIPLEVQQSDMYKKLQRFLED